MKLRGAWITVLMAFAVMASGVPASGWFFDRGLEDRVVRMKELFDRRELMSLYDGFVDDRLKINLEKSATVIKDDRRNGPLMARRLHFGGYGDFQKAEPRRVVERFFYAMTHPPEKKGRPVRNAEYLTLAFELTVLFACFDDGMKLVKRDISGNRARLYYSGNNLKMIAHYIYRDRKWYLTRQGF